VDGKALKQARETFCHLNRNSMNETIEFLVRHGATVLFAVIFVEQLPHTATGKLLKTQLRQEYRDHLLRTTQHG